MPQQDDAADAAAPERKCCAEDFKRLKVLLRMLEERIAQATPAVRARVFFRACLQPAS